MKKLLVLTLTTFALISTLSYAQNGWVQHSNGPAKGRTGCFVIGNYGYYGGGNDNPGPNETNTWFRYDPITDSWSSIANMPMGLQAIEGFSINGKGYAGIGFAGGSSHADFFEYDTSNNSWTAKASYPGSGVNIPHDAGSFVINGEGYILGGAISYSNSTQAVCNKYNPISNTWISIAPLPTPKRVALGASINGYGYAFFGQNPYNSGIPDTSCYKYDPIADSWTSIPSAPIYSERYSSFELNGKLYLICNADSTYNDFYEFDPTNNTWTQLPFRPTSFIAQATFVINNRAFVIFHTGEVWEYTPPTPPTCLVAYYPFSGNAVDSSGNGNNGIVNGATLTTDRFGNANSAYFFDGSDSVPTYVEVPNSASLNFGTGDFTITTWIQTSYSGSQMIMHKGLGFDNPQYFLRLHDTPNNDIMLMTSSGGVSNSYPSSNVNIANVSNGGWHFVVAQRENDSIKIYYDCNLISSTHVSIVNVDNPNSLFIGLQNWYDNATSAGPFGNYFHGKIDDVRIYNCALSVSELNVLCAGNNCNLNLALSISPTNASCPDSNDGSADLTVNGAGNTTLSYLWSNGETNEDISGVFAGTYTVTVSYGSGCSVTSSVNIVSTGTSPVAVVTPAGPLTTCSNITLTATGGDTYQWLKNGIAISGATNSTYKASATGSYGVVVSNNCGTDTSNIVSVTKYAQPSLALTTSGPTTFCQNGSVTFTAYSNAGINATYQWKRNGINISGATQSSYTASQNGIVKVIVTNTQTGCSRTSSGVNVIKQLVTATISANGPTAVCNDNVILSVTTNAVNGATYQWKKNGINIPNANSPTYSTKDPGVYKIVVTNSNGCTKTSNSITITISCREGFNENISEMEVHIKPNPTNDYADISYSLAQESSVKIELLSIVGEKVKVLKNESQKEGDQKIRIQTNELSPGFYFVNLTIGNRVFSKKLVVQK